MQCVRARLLSWLISGLKYSIHGHLGDGTSVTARPRLAEPQSDVAPGLHADKAVAPSTHSKTSDMSAAGERNGTRNGTCNGTPIGDSLWPENARARCETDTATSGSAFAGIAGLCRTYAARADGHRMSSPRHSRGQIER